MNILLLDDHRMTLEGYPRYLNPKENDFYKVLNCKDFYEWLIGNPDVDFAIIDQELPPYPEKELTDGCDCALLLKNLKPDCKVIIITSHDEAVILYNINQKGKPDALISKSDFDEEMIMNIISLKTPLPFFSPRAKEAMAEINKKQTLWDPVNREILMYLSLGFKISQLENILPLTKSGIQKKVSKMIQDFNVRDYQDLIQLLKKEDWL